MFRPATELVYLHELEQYFRKKLESQSPKLLGDIILSLQKVDEIGLSLGAVLRSYPREKAGKYSLTISLFLVWSAIYHYKEGNFWAPIFEKLHCEYNMNDCKWLGEIFLGTIYSNGLQRPTGGKHKKYMTPILMHGYISEYYTPQFLDYLNALYSSYLEYDLSEEALDGLWEDYFNFDREQIEIKNLEGQLKQKELELLKKMDALQLPPTLNKNSKTQIESLEGNASKGKSTIAGYSQELASLEAKKNQLKDAFIVFEKCSAVLGGGGALEKTKEEQLNSFKEITCLCTVIENEFASKLQALEGCGAELNKKLQAEENALKIVETRKNHLLTEVVKLGNGDIEKGYIILNDYTEIARELDKIQEQKGRREKVFEGENKLGNSNLRQIFTTSLTCLAEANPCLFQEFIKSTLKLIAAYAGDQTMPKDHRLSEAVQRWGVQPRIKEKLRRKERPGLREVGAQGVSEKSLERIRLKNMILRRPELKYDSERKQLQVDIPVQDIPAPPNFHQAPQYTLKFKDRQETISCQYQLQKKELKTNRLDANLTDNTFTGIAFNWYNLYEYWDLRPQPVMVFTEEGRLQDSRHFPNGFYYILARSFFEPGPHQVITKYPCDFPGYIVYEFNGVENKLDFYAAKEETISLTFSRYPDISLQGVEFLPGLKQDSFPVCRGTPVVTIKQKFAEETGRDAVFVLNYNGGKLYEGPLLNLSKFRQEEPDSIGYRFPLNDFVLPSAPTHWQTFEVRILGKKGEIYFEDAFCLLEVFSVFMDNGLLKVRLPAKSRLKGTIAKNTGNEYWLTCHRSSEVFFQVYFDRIGWKQFSAELPCMCWRLCDESEGLHTAPLVFLQSETDLMRNITLELQSASAATKRVVIADDQNNLVQKFNVRGTDLKIPLENLAELFTNQQETGYIHIYCEGDIGRSLTECVAEIYPRIELGKVELFCSEQEEEYLVELFFTTEYPHLDRLYFRCYTDEGDLLFSQPVRSSTDYFYLNKAGLTAIAVSIELYYTEKITSIFGDHDNETICWQGTVNLPNLKGIYQRLKQEGLILTGFTYDGEYCKLAPSYRIKNISLSSRNFEGEELLSGNFVHKDIPAKVYFYIDYINDQALISVLWDEDYDALQYDPSTGNLAWEVCEGDHIKGPLENLEFDFLGGAEK